MRFFSSVFDVMWCSNTCIYSILLYQVSQNCDCIDRICLPIRLFTMFRNFIKKITNCFKFYYVSSRFTRFLYFIGMASNHPNYLFVQFRFTAKLPLAVLFFYFQCLYLFSSSIHILIDVFFLFYTKKRKKERKSELIYRMLNVLDSHATLHKILCIQYI